MTKLARALIAGLLGLGLAGGVYADDTTRVEKKGVDARYDAAVEKAKAD